MQLLVVGAKRMQCLTMTNIVQPTAAKWQLMKFKVRIMATDFTKFVVYKRPAGSWIMWDPCCAMWLQGYKNFDAVLVSLRALNSSAMGKRCHE